jgi:hypothetical protein
MIISIDAQKSFAIDAEKSFDNFQPTFMIKTLNKLGIEGSYLNIQRLCMINP